ncbi:MAG: Pyridoxal-dependent decarboxylase, partial [Conexibacter sp.]|nr:Pyridoxal-dependent decarboxylase [Conexibacter sp.]
TPGFEVVTPPSLAIVCFRVPGDPDELARRALADGYVVPSTTVLRGETVLRLCTINPRTTDQELAGSVARLAALAG